MKTMTLGLGLAAALTLGLALAGLFGSAGPSTPPADGIIRHKPIAESSGVIASRGHPGVLWTHNDQNNPAVIYAITRDGNLIAEFRVDARNDDWEDIAIDDDGHLYLGNIGNNGGERSTIEVLCVAEPNPHDPAASLHSLKVLKNWRLRFSGEPFDCESLFIHKGHGYVISKVFKRQQAVLYRFDLARENREVVLEQVATLPIYWPVTAADISSDAQRLAVVCTKGLYVFVIDGDPAKIASAPSAQVPFPKPNDIEGACFVPGGILTTAESRHIHFYSDAALSIPQTSSR